MIISVLIFWRGRTLRYWTNHPEERPAAFRVKNYKGSQVTVTAKTEVTDVFSVPPFSVTVPLLRALALLATTVPSVIVVPPV